MMTRSCFTQGKTTSGTKPKSRNRFEVVLSCIRSPSIITGHSKSFLFISWFKQSLFRFVHRPQYCYITSHQWVYYRGSFAVNHELYWINVVSDDIVFVGTTAAPTTPAAPTAPVGLDTTTTNSASHGSKFSILVFALAGVLSLIM